MADTANHSSHVADTANHSLSLVSLIGSVVEYWQCCVGCLTLCVMIFTEESSSLRRVLEGSSLLQEAVTELGHVIRSTFLIGPVLKYWILIGAGFSRPKIFRVNWKYFRSRFCYHWVGSLDFSVINLSLSAESEDCESVTSCEDCESEISCEDCEPVKSCEIWKQIWVIPNRSYCRHWFMFILLDSCSQIL